MWGILNKADLANKATDATEANGANKADAVDKPNEDAFDEVVEAEGHG